MINKSDKVNIIKSEGTANTRNFGFIVKGISPMFGKDLEIKRAREMKNANDVNDIGMNIKARSKPIDVRISVIVGKVVERVVNGL
jgi:hypothetical protein